MAGLTKVKGSGLATGAATDSLVGIADNATSTAITIDASENVNLGSSVPIDGLRYLDLFNTSTGSSAGALLRIVTSNAAGTGNTTTDIIKYKNSGFLINNNDTASSNFTALGVAGAERMRINSAGNVGIRTSTPSDFLTVSDGAKFDQAYSIAAPATATNFCATFGSSSVGSVLCAGGINLNGDTAAANTLDDYEEGTWDATPSTSTTTLIPLSGWTVVSHVGYYVKVGKLVTVSWYFDWSNTNTSSSSINLILPFASAGSNIWAGNGTEVSMVSFPSGATYVTARVESGGSHISFKGCGSSISRVDMQFANFGAYAGGYALGSLSYFTP